ncbi:MAG: HAD family hydrolase, partial [Eubacteriaceae bacterium]
MIKLIFWDFDGTLADTIELVTGLFVKTASDYAGRAVTADEVRATFGLNERGTFRRLLGDQADQAFDDYLEYYIQAHNEISVFPGVRELLRDLKLQGTRNILVTGKGPECCEISLEKLKLMKLFDEIRPGFDDKADKAGEMLDAIEDFNVTPDQCVYIGDTVSD